MVCFSLLKLNRQNIPRQITQNSPTQNCTHTKKYSSMWYLVDIDAVSPHVVPVVDLSPLSKVHGQDSLCGQIPVDLRNLREARKGTGQGIRGRRTKKKTTWLN